ncbi:hypothetical protein HFP71_16850 [Streptomyces sp. ARC32]
MSERTIPVSLLVVKGIEVAEPDWCVDPHQIAQFRTDITHSGPETWLTFRGENVTPACLIHAPYSVDPIMGVSVDLIGQTLDADGVREFAADLVDYAGRLRDLADQLTLLQERGGA